jgi:hypothetical protein
MESQEFKCFDSEFDIKVDNQMSGKVLKTILQKLAISIWNKLCRENQNQQMMIQNSPSDSNRHGSSFQANQVAKRITQRLFVLISMDIFRFEQVSENSFMPTVHQNKGTAQLYLDNQSFHVKRGTNESD